MLLAISLTVIAFAAAFHAHWALGGKLGYSVSLPQEPGGRPVMAHRLPWWRPAAAGVACCLMVLAALLLDRARVVDLGVPDPFVRIPLSVVGATFVARSLVPNRYVGFFKSLRTIRWAKFDTALYSPLFLLLGLLILMQAM